MEPELSTTQSEQLLEKLPLGNGGELMDVLYFVLYHIDLLLSKVEGAVVIGNTGIEI